MSSNLYTTLRTAGILSLDPVTGEIDRERTATAIFSILESLHATESAKERAAAAERAEWAGVCQAAVEAVLPIGSSLPTDKVVFKAAAHMIKAKGLDLDLLQPLQDRVAEWLSGVCDRDSKDTGLPYKTTRRVGITRRR